MEKQTLITAIACLTGALDALKRADATKEIAEVVEKISSLVKQL